MLESIIHPVIAFISATIASWGLIGVIVLMGIESMNIPLPSEVILPFAGFLVAQGKIGFHGAAFAGAFGCVFGSLLSYAIGYYGGRPFLLRYGKWLFLSEKELQKAEAWDNRYGLWVYFIARMLPVVRTFISLPAGILRTRLLPFTVLTFLGSWIWSYLLVYVGVRLGEHWSILRSWFEKFDILIVAAILGGIIWIILRHRNRSSPLG